MQGLVNDLIIPVRKSLSENFGNQEEIFTHFFFIFGFLDLWMEKPVYVEFSELSFVPLMKSSYIIRTFRQLLWIMLLRFHFQEISHTARVSFLQNLLVIFKFSGSSQILESSSLSWLSSSASSSSSS